MKLQICIYKKENIQGTPNKKCKGVWKGVIEGVIKNDDTGDVIKALAFVRIKGCKNCILYQAKYIVKTVKQSPFLLTLIFHNFESINIPNLSFEKQLAVVSFHSSYEQW